MGEVMLNNSTCLWLCDVNSSQNSVEIGKRQDLPLYSLSLASLIIIAALSPVAVVGNALVLAAIRKKTFSITQFHSLLSCLAITDICTGLITQPVIVVEHLMSYTKSSVRNAHEVGNISLLYFGMVTLLFMTLMSLERWKFMTRRSLATSRRGFFMVRIIFFLIPIPIIGLRAASILTIEQLNIAASLFALTCLVIMSVSYFKIAEIIRKHRRQVQGNHFAQSFGQPAINIAKFRKSLASVFYILALWLFCYLPINIISVVRFIVGKTEEVEAMTDLCLVFLFLCSSLNPGLYLWRMTELRIGVKALFC